VTGKTGGFERKSVNCSEFLRVERRVVAHSNAQT
jgi:hypothetical protein